MLIKYFPVSNSIWGGYNNQGSQVISNPFTANDLWRPSNNLINNNNVQISDNTLNNSANPFRQIQFSVNNGSAFGNNIFFSFNTQKKKQEKNINKNIYY